MSVVAEVWEFVFKCMDCGVFPSIAFHRPMTKLAAATFSFTNTHAYCFGKCLSHMVSL